VLDLSFNKLNDFEEVLELMNGYAVRKGTIRVVAIKGNSFYNFNDSNCTAISNDLEGQDLVDKFSLYGSDS